MRAAEARLSSALQAIRIIYRPQKGVCPAISTPSRLFYFIHLFWAMPVATHSWRKQAQGIRRNISENAEDHDNNQECLIKRRRQFTCRRHSFDIPQTAPYI